MASLPCIEGVDEAASCACERGADRSGREPDLSRDLLIGQPGIPEEQDLAVTLTERLEDLAHRRAALPCLEGGGGVGRRLGVDRRLPTQEGEVALPPYDEPC